MRACGENYYLSGARTKHHLEFRPLVLLPTMLDHASRQAVIIGVSYTFEKGYTLAGNFIFS
jgi:hypothetical protein